MTFLHGTLLAAGMGAIALPILIHLLMRRRRKPVPWAAMRFVLEAYRRTRRRLILERWLLLALRCLALAALAVVIGRPVVGGAGVFSGGERGRTVYVVIDDSIASAALDAPARAALARHLDRARSLIAALRDGDRVGIVLAGAPARGLLLPASPNLPAALSLLDSVATTEARADLPGAVRLAAEAVASARQREPGADPPERTHVLVLGDLTAGSADGARALPTLPAGVGLLSSPPRGPGEGTPVNVAVAGIAPQEAVLAAGGESSARSTVVAVRLERSGAGVDAAATSALAVALMETGRAGGTLPRELPGASVRTTVRWSAGQREAVVNVAVPLPAAWSAGTCALEARLEEDALPADNAARVPIELREGLRVGLVAGGRGGRAARGVSPESLPAHEWVALALRPRESAGIEVVWLEAGGLDAGALAGLDAVWATDPARLSAGDWARLAQWARGQLTGGTAGSGGGLLIVSPSAEQTVHTWPDELRSALGLPWTMAREARLLAQDQAGSAEQGMDGGAARLSAEPRGGGARPADLDLLGPLRGELADLARAVSVERLLPLTAAGDAGVPLLWLADGTPWLWCARLPVAEPTEARAGAAGGEAQGQTAHAARVRSGAVVYMASAPELAWTNLPVKPLMVPLLHELVRQGVGGARPAAAMLAGERAQAPGQAVRLRSLAPGGAPEGAAIGVDAAGQSAEALRRAGLYEAVDQRGVRRAVIAVNPDATGSRVDRSDPATVGAWLSGALAAGGLRWLEDPSDAPTGPGGAGGIETVSLTTLLSTRATGRGTGPEWMLIVLALLVAELLLARRSGPGANAIGTPALAGGATVGGARG